MRPQVYLLAWGSPLEASMAAARTTAPVPAPVRWTTTVDDLVDGSHLTAIGLRRFVALIGVGALVWGALTLATGDVPFGLFLLAYGAVDLGVIYARPLERAIVSRQGRQLLGRACEVSLTDTGVAFRQGEAVGALSWQNLTGVREDERTMLLVAGKAARFGIPKRAFSSPEAAVAFRDSVLARISSASAS